MKYETKTLHFAVEPAARDDEKNVSDAELGRRLGGVSRQWVNAIVNGRKEMTVRRLHEVADALDRNDLDALCEELGDVLMHIVFHASIGKQYSEFTFRDIVTEIVRKMVYRHPHVFGPTVVRTSDEVLANWDRLKKSEKHYTGLSDEMRRIPKCFPGLLRSRKIQSKAAKIGVDFESPEAALEKVKEEADELLEAMKNGKGKEEEFGDLLFSVVNVGRLLHLEPEEMMQRSNDKFVERISKMESLAREQGTELSRMDTVSQNELWEKTKNPHN